MIDDRVRRILINPKTYFAEARQRIRQEVIREMNEERRLRKWWYR